MALFVEGQTEQMFAQSLVSTCAGQCNVQIVSRKGSGGRKYTRIFMEIEAKKIGTGEDYFVLIIDSGSDEGVITDIKEKFSELVNQNFQMIVGIRDVYPRCSKLEIEKFQAGMEFSIAALNGIPIDLYLSVMEVEAWLLSENTHFLRMAPELTEERIRDELGFFPDNKNAESRDIPSDDLAAIYDIAEISYDKSRMVVEKVINSLDFEDIINVHAVEISSLGGVVNKVSNFFEA